MKLTRLLAIIAMAGLFAAHVEAQTVAPSTPAMVKLTQTPPSSSISSPSSSPSTAAAVQTSADAGKASEVVAGFYAQLVDSMKQGDQLGFAGRYKKLDPAIKTAFNLPLMTRFAVGLDWDKATPDEQAQLVSAFSDFSIATYANQFKSYNGESFKVIAEKPASEGIMVQTQLTPKDGAPVSIDYLMKPDEQGKMRIVDVFLDGAISQLAAQRSQFTSIVRRDGIPALVNTLGDKAKEMGPTS